MNSSDYRCSNCAFFFPIGSIPFPEHEEETTRGGECRRKPPMQRANTRTFREIQDGVKKEFLRGSFPLVILNDWCGEFRPGDAK